MDRKLPYVPHVYECGSHTIIVEVVSIPVAGNLANGISLASEVVIISIDGLIIVDSPHWHYPGAEAQMMEAINVVAFVLQLKFEDLPLHVNSVDKVVFEICKLRLEEG